MKKPTYSEIDQAVEEAIKRIEAQARATFGEDVNPAPFTVGYLGGLLKTTLALSGNRAAFENLQSAGK